MAPVSRSSPRPRSRSAARSPIPRDRAWPPPVGSSRTRACSTGGSASGRRPPTSPSITRSGQRRRHVRARVGPIQEGDRVLYAHDLPLELWAELGIAGAAVALALYAAVGAALARARRSPALWLAGPAVAAFMLANLVDFPWHLAGAGAVWALALGILIAAGRPGRSGPSRPPGPESGAQYVPRMTNRRTSQRSDVDILHVAGGATPGWRVIDETLRHALLELDVSLARVAITRPWGGLLHRARSPANDLYQAACLTAVARRGLQQFRPRAIIYSTSHAALLQPRRVVPEALWVDGP